MQVLIVDDEPLARSALQAELGERTDVQEIAVAHDAVEALDKLNKRDFDVLLLDIRMPEMSGIELVDRLKKSGRQIPAIIFVTAHHEHAVTAFEKHAVDYVLKPFSSERGARGARYRGTALGGRARSQPDANPAADAVPSGEIREDGD